MKDFWTPACSTFQPTAIRESAVNECEVDSLEDEFARPSSVRCSVTEERLIEGTVIIVVGIENETRREETVDAFMHPSTSYVRVSNLYLFCCLVASSLPSNSLSPLCSNHSKFNIPIDWLNCNNIAHSHIIPCLYPRRALINH